MIVRQFERESSRFREFENSGESSRDQECVSSTIQEKVREFEKMRKKISRV